ncbi:MAG: tetratricopeptide repeat protein [Bacteroidetes bacterium]|nr:tetratricopeptide repeat protein [Bacteroidota bacterium]MDA1119952.1 tetratricopeptide repeat protein [Bacteroidota bacterium]
MQIKFSIFKLLVSCWIILITGSCNLRYGQHPLELPVFDGSINEMTLEAINRSLIDNPQNINLLKRKVSLMASFSWPIGSQEAIDEALNKVDDDGELHFYASDYYYSKGQLAAARQHSVDASQYGFLTGDYFELYAQILMALNEFDEAIIQAKRFESLDAKNYRSLLLQGKIFVEIGDTIPALQAFKKAFDLQKNDPDLNLELLDLYLAVGDTANSSNIQTYLPDTPPNWRMETVKLKLNHGMTNDAIKDLNDILLSNPDNIESLKMLANLYFKQGRFEPAISTALETLKIDSLELNMRLLAARAYDKSFRYQSAIDQYQSLLAIDSTFKIARSEMDLVFRKVTYLRLKQEQESIPVFDLTPRRREQGNVNNNLE